jgi:hypothetical protein
LWSRLRRIDGEGDGATFKAGEGVSVADSSGSYGQIKDWFAALICDQIGKGLRQLNPIICVDFEGWRHLNVVVRAEDLVGIAIGAGD